MRVVVEGLRGDGGEEGDVLGGVEGGDGGGRGGEGAGDLHTGVETVVDHQIVGHADTVGLHRVPLPVVVVADCGVVEVRYAAFAAVRGGGGKRRAAVEVGVHGGDGSSLSLSLSGHRAMALLMEKGSEPQTDSEIADLEAITALKESAAIELKVKGNEYVKMGKKHYSDALDCYTRAINQKVLSDSENSILFSNRAHVNLLLGNLRRALVDAEEAIKLCPTNVKALYRAVKASLSLNKLSEAKQYCEKGLEQSPDNEELRKLFKQIDLQKSECDRRDAEISKSVAAAKGILFAMEDRKLKMGKASFQELTGLKKPSLDEDKILHWPVLLLYAEVMSSDIIEDFCETDMFSAHLDMMFSESYLPLPWDKDNAYTREAVELYYEAGSGSCQSKKEILRHLLEGTVGSGLENFGNEAELNDDSLDRGFSAAGGPSKWVKVNEKSTLHGVLKDPKFVIPGIPVFYVVSKRSRFYNDFRAGKWIPPRLPDE